MKEGIVPQWEGAIMLLSIIAGWQGPTFTGITVVAVIIWMLYRWSKKP